MRTTPARVDAEDGVRRGIDDASQQRVAPAQPECVGKCPQRLLVERAQRARQEDGDRHEHRRCELDREPRHEYASTKVAVCDARMAMTPARQARQPSDRPMAAVSAAKAARVASWNHYGGERAMPWRAVSRESA